MMNHIIIIEAVLSFWIGLFSPRAFASGEGRASTFGGPSDWNDRCHNQAYLPLPGGRSPAAYYRWVADDVRAVLSPSMASAQAWPWVPAIGGGRCRVGVSYYLTGHYAALPLVGAIARDGQRGRPIWARVRVGDRVIDVRVTDWGPARGRWATVDLSPETYEALGLAWRRDRVKWEVR
jgi:hypothetical protein